MGKKTANSAIDFARLFAVKEKLATGRAPSCVARVEDEAGGDGKGEGRGETPTTTTTASPAPSADAVRAWEPEEAGTDAIAARVACSAREAGARTPCRQM